MLAVYFLLAANKFLYSEDTKTPNTWQRSPVQAGKQLHLFFSPPDFPRKDNEYPTVKGMVFRNSLIFLVGNLGIPTFSKC